MDDRSTVRLHGDRGCLPPHTFRAGIVSFRKERRIRAAALGGRGHWAEGDGGLSRSPLEGGKRTLVVLRWVDGWCHVTRLATAFLLFLLPAASSISVARPLKSDFRPCSHLQNVQSSAFQGSLSNMEDSAKGPQQNLDDDTETTPRLMQVGSNQRMKVVSGSGPQEIPSFLFII